MLKISIDTILTYLLVFLTDDLWLTLQEKVLEIEYIKAVVPRKEEEPSLHDDWVSAVDGSSDGYASEFIIIVLSVP